MVVSLREVLVFVFFCGSLAAQDIRSSSTFSQSIVTPAVGSLLETDVAITLPAWNDRLGTIAHFDVSISVSSTVDTTLTFTNPLVGQNIASTGLTLELLFGDDSVELELEYRIEAPPSSIPPGTYERSIPLGASSSALTSESPLSPTSLAVRHSAFAASHGPGVSLQATWHSMLTGEYIRFYTPKSEEEYVYDALQRINRSGTANSMVANVAYADIISLREYDAETSGSNLALRDAEYFLRGYAGGSSLYEKQEMDWSDINEWGNRGGPVAWAGYSAIKLIKQGILGINISGGDALPGTPVGGGISNGEGYLRGLRGDSIEDLLMTFGGRRAAPALHSLEMLATEPISSMASVDLLLEGKPATLRTFSLNTSDHLDAELEITFAPVQSWAVYGNRFKSLTLTIENEETALLLAFLDFRLTIASGMTLDLTQYAADGIDSFLLVGDSETNFAGTILFEFSAAGEFLVSSASASTFVVPETEGGALLVLGLLTCLFGRRRGCVGT